MGKLRLMWTWALAVMGAAAVVAVDTGDEALMHQRLVGWLGEVDRTMGRKELIKFPAHFASNDVIIGNDAPQSVESDRWIQQISWKPRAFLFRNFLNASEADHLVGTAMPKMKRSQVIATEDENETSDYRTSYGACLVRNQDSIVKGVQDKVAAWSHIPDINQEDIQVLRYTNGQQYRPHTDVLNVDEDGSRIATAIIYLNDCEEGGETAFPTDSEWIYPNLGQDMGPWSECANGHVAVKPRKGDALLFFSLHPNGELDEASEHAGCPVPVNHVKWTATIWIHTAPFRADTFDTKANKFLGKDPGDCQDFESECRMWKAVGECERNPDVMVGDIKGMGQMGMCRKTCGICEVCARNDRECYFKNREKAGYLNLEELWPKGGKRAPVHISE